MVADADDGSSSSVFEDRSAPVAARPRRRSASERVRKNLPNILLYTQENEPVRFYDDLVEDKIVSLMRCFGSHEKGPERGGKGVETR